jgi:hypothetical protein
MKKIIVILVFISILNANSLFSQNKFKEVTPQMVIVREQIVGNEKFLNKWYEKSIPLSDFEYQNLDTISKLAYIVYEFFINDSNTFLRLKRISNKKYFLTPASFDISMDKSKFDENRKHFFYFEMDSFAKTIMNFRPRLKIYKSLYRHAQNVKIPKEIGTIPEIELTPSVTNIFVCRDSDLIIIQYIVDTYHYLSLFRYSKDKLTYIKDLEVIAYD